MVFLTGNSIRYGNCTISVDSWGDGNGVITMSDTDDEEWQFELEVSDEPCYTTGCPDCGEYIETDEEPPWTCPECGAEF